MRTVKLWTNKRRTSARGDTPRGTVSAAQWSAGYRDRDGRHGLLSVYVADDEVTVGTADGTVLRLSAAEVGRLRSALREALVIATARRHP